jgi:sec-independent protein translocase protein TatC
VVSLLEHGRDGDFEDGPKQEIDRPVSPSGPVSGAIDEDVVRTVDSGRETLGAMLSAAQGHLQKVFLVFVAGLMLTIWGLRAFVWNRMQTDLHTNPNIQVVAVTPFDVILLQVKIGLVVGALVSVPFLLYYARDGLRERDLWIPDRVDLERWKIVLLVLASVLLLLAGAAYAYLLFFPLMLDFLASNAVQAGFEPTYSIVLWAQFIFLLTLSFGLAAQLPLVMSGLAYAEIVPYETFRDRWKYAVIGIFVFGALFSPPDPFTQIMWAVPLLFLYGASLSLARFVVTARVSSEVIGFRRLARERWNLVGGVAVVVGGLVYFVSRGAFSGQYDATLGRLPAPVRPGLFARETLLGLPVEYVLAVVAVVAGLLAGLVALTALLFRALEDLPSPEERARRARGGAGEVAPASTGDPADFPFDAVSADAIRDTVPAETFAALSEEEALAEARRALREEEDPDKAEAILDRFDEVHAELAEIDLSPDADAAGSDDAADGRSSAGEPTAAGPAGTWTLDADGPLGALVVGRGRVNWADRFGQAWNVLAGLVVLALLAAYLGVAGEYLPASALTPLVGLTGLPAEQAALLAGGVVGLVLATLLAAGLAVSWAYRAGTDPSGVDFSTLSAEEVRTAPSRAFYGVTEDDASAIAGRAVSEGDREKAEAVLDRFDEILDERERAEARRRHGADEAEGDENVFSRTGAGMASAFTDEEVDEDDIGGYYYDIAFIFESLTSKAFRLVGLFMLVLAGTFVFLYQGGIGALKNTFYAQLPASISPETVNLVTLHPVEALIFEIKVSTIFAAVATLPLILYYAWPALKERGFARGDRNVLLTWAGSLFVGLLVGSVIGFLVIAPTIISWLAADVARADMVIAYRINNFGWLVFFTTVGVGLLLDIPVTMFLFHRGGLVPYRTMRDRWREVTVTVLAVAALASPQGVFTMFLFGIPIMAAYGLGLGILRVYVALGGKGGRPPLVRGQGAD